MNVCTYVCTYVHVYMLKVASHSVSPPSRSGTSLHHGEELGERIMVVSRQGVTTCCQVVLMVQKFIGQYGVGVAFSGLEP